MSKIPTLNEFIHILLVDKGLDGFSVPTLRDELLKLTDRFDNDTEARKFVYRQLRQLEKKGLLSTTGSGRGKIYHKTQIFHEVRFVQQSENKTATKQLAPSELRDIDLEELMHEKARCAAELEFAVTGIDEYRSLADRLPTLQSELLAKSEQSRERSVQYTVKLEALIYAIELHQSKEATC